MGKKKNIQKKADIQAGQSSGKIWMATGMVLIVSVLVILGIVYNQKPDEVQRVTDTTVEHNQSDIHILGNPAAINQIVVYSDFGCVFCAMLDPLMRRFIEEHHDDYNLRVRHYPINNNMTSRIAIQAVIAGGRQGKYWEMTDLVYDTVDSWRRDPVSTFTDLAMQLELDMEQFVRDMNDQELMYKIVRDYNEASSAGINSTPSIFLNGERVQNVRTYEELLTVLK